MDKVTIKMKKCSVSKRTCGGYDQYMLILQKEHGSVLEKLLNRKLKATVIFEEIS